MVSQAELARAVEELQKATGLPLQISAVAPEELEHAYLQVRQLTGAYKEKYNKEYFLRNLMEGKIQSAEVDEYAKKLHIAGEEKRILFLIETKTEVDDFLIELLKNLYPIQNKNYIVKMDRHKVVLLKPVKCEEEDVPEVSMVIAHTIVDSVNAEAMSSVRVSFGRRIDRLLDIAKSYEEASLAVRIGNIFYTEQTIIPYNQLGIGRLIYQLPAEICYNFLHEIFGEEINAGLDEEIQMTAHKFLQNNLNIAETSRQLHMHRNTLIYRIEQIQKQTGLDIRVFEDALTFQIAMMVISYIHAPIEK